MEDKTNIGFTSKNYNFIKIFNDFTEKDSLSITRLGDTIVLEKLWAAFRVEIPEGYNIINVSDSLSSLKDEIFFSHPNLIIKRFAVPNDDFFSNQTALYNSNAFPNCDMNVELTWDEEVGKQFVKIGVIDDIVAFTHEDFGGWNHFPNNKIFGGYYFSKNRAIQNSDIIGNSPQIFNSHRTAMAGIIAALRGNNIGISGIARGDMENDQNIGCRIFTLPIFDNILSSTNTNWNSMVTTASNAIFKGSAKTTTGYGYGLEILNKIGDLNLGNLVILIPNHGLQAF